MSCWPRGPAVTVSRSGDTRILLGQRGSVTLTVTNPGRELHGVLRDALAAVGLGGPARSR